MESKLIGYILAGLGIAGIALTNVLQNALSFIPAKPPYVLLGSVALVIIGIVLLMSNKPKHPKEVPVYDKHGKEIVGYRRMK